jgi:DNA-binding transcriptional regulator YiaG
MSPKELKQARKELGLSQYKLADVLQTTRNTVARWERGEQTMTHITGLAVQYLLLTQKPKPKGSNRK